MPKVQRPEGGWGGQPRCREKWCDKIAMHPLWGGVLLLAILFLSFQAVFAWAEWPKGLIEDGIAALSANPSRAGTVPGTCHFPVYSV